MHVVPGTQETEAGGSFGLKSSELVWATQQERLCVLKKERKKETDQPSSYTTTERKEVTIVCHKISGLMTMYSCKILSLLLRTSGVNSYNPHNI
jgi:hypothetical protein